MALHVALVSPKRTTKRPPQERPDGTGVLNINLPLDLLEELKTWTERLNADPNGPRWTRTDVIRITLARAVKERGAKGEAP